MNEQHGKLSVVATPIGNLEDITIRGINTLSEANYILCEDTRVTGKLRDRYNITTPLKRYDAHVPDAVHERILSDLAEGKHIALVSDAGTPGVSDPGVMIVSLARENGHQVVAVPGPSSVTAAFSIAGISGNQFAFLGFVPQKKGRQSFFEALPARSEPVMFFESTHRIMKTLQSLHTIAVNRDSEMIVYLGRELTKLHEEMLVGIPSLLIETLTKEPVRQKGEFVVIVSR